jgi:DNA end-binding protein Ku
MRLRSTVSCQRQQIDQRFFDTPYYVAPNEPVAQEAFAVIREAMRHKSMVALGRLVLSKRERVIALEPYGKGLLGTTLRYAYEVRDAKDCLPLLKASSTCPRITRR